MFFFCFFTVIKCKKCDLNTYSNVAKRTLPCKTCAIGRTSEESSVKCSSCTPGRYVVAASGTCLQCPAGFISNITNSPDCSRCGLDKIGEYSKEGDSSCSPCDSGMYQIRPGVCEDCFSGSYQDGKGSKRCLECPKDTYSSIKGRSSKADCIKCNIDRSTGPSIGNIDAAACLCKRKDYYQDDVSCSKCPNGGDCSASDGLPSVNITAQNGYWKATKNSTKFSDCSKGYQGLKADELSKQRCNISNSNINNNDDEQWSSDSQCEATYRGTLCLECIEDYVRIGDDCKKCKGGASLGMAFMAGAGMIIPVFVGVMVSLLCESKTQNVAAKTNKTIGQIKILVGFVQILSSMQTTYNNIPWPTAFIAFTIPLVAINLDVVGLFGTSYCSMAVPFAYKFIIHMSIPPMLAIGILLAYVVSKICKPPETKELTAHRKAQTFKLLIAMILFMYPGLATRCFQMFKCSSFHGVAYDVLEADPSMICYQEEHMLYISLSIIFVCLYIVGIPIAMFLVLYRNRKHLYTKAGEEPTKKHEEVVFEIGGLYTQYEPRFWYFEIIIIIHKCMMTGAMVIVGNGTPLQPLVAMLIQMLFLLLVLKMAPYNDDLDDWSSFVSSLVLTLTTLAGYTLMIKTDREDTFVVAPEIITNILIVTNAACFVYQMVVIGYVAYQDKVQRRKLKKSGSSGTPNKRTRVQPMDADVGVVNNVKNGDVKNFT